jgi:hypothetical protein
MITTDTQCIAITSNHPDIQFGPRGLDTCGNRWRTPMNGMNPIGIHVVWETTGTSNSGDKHCVFSWHIYRWQDFFDLRENRVVPATRAPTNFLITGKVGRFQYRQGGVGTHEKFSAQVRGLILRGKKNLFFVQLTVFKKKKWLRATPLFFLLFR